MASFRRRNHHEGRQQPERCGLPPGRPDSQHSSERSQPKTGNDRAIKDMGNTLLTRQDQRRILLGTPVAITTIQVPLSFPDLGDPVGQGQSARLPATETSRVWPSAAGFSTEGRGDRRDEVPPRGGL